MKNIQEMKLDELMAELKELPAITNRARDLIGQIEKLKGITWVPTSLTKQGHYVSTLDEY